MSLCRDAQQTIRREVLIPVMQALTQWEQACRQYRHAVEREVVRPMETWVEGAQTTCNRLPWPLSWLCTTVVTIIRVIVLVVELVVEWVVSILCEVVAVVVQVVVRVIAIVVELVVALVTCVGDSRGFTGAMLDLWTGLVGVGEKALDLVESLLDAVGLILEDVADVAGSVIMGVLSLFGDPGIALGSMLAGIVKHVGKLLRRVTETARDVIDHAQDIVGGILRGDFCRVASGFVGLLMDAGGVLLTAVNGVFGVFGSVAHSWDYGHLTDNGSNRSLATLIDAKLARTFGDERATLARVRQRIRIHQRPFGLPVRLLPERLYVSSRSATLSVLQLHREGVFNLFRASGGPDTCEGRTISDTPHWEVVYAGTNLPVLPSDLSAYVAEGEFAVPEFRVYAMVRHRFERYLAVARRKGFEIGLDFNWVRVLDREATVRDDVTVPFERFEAFLRRSGRNGGDAPCRVPAIAVHGYDPASLTGLASSGTNPATGPSGVTFRERLPEFVFQYVLAHELGHYFGLDHAGHHGAHHVMYTSAAADALQPVTWDTVATAFVGAGEPTFSLADAGIVWDWLLANARSCVRGD